MQAGIFVEAIGFCKTVPQSCAASDADAASPNTARIENRVHYEAAAVAVLLEGVGAVFELRAKARTFDVGATIHLHNLPGICFRPKVQFFLLDGLRAQNVSFGIYHYDAHVHRDITLDHITAKPLNGGYDEEILTYGDFTYDRLTFANCRLERDPLIQLTGIATARSRPSPSMGTPRHALAHQLGEYRCGESEVRPNITLKHVPPQ